MERLKNMSLRKSFFLLTLCGLLAAVALVAALWAVCAAASSQYPLGGVTIGSDGVMTPLPQPTPEQMRILKALGVIPLVGCILFPAAGLATAGALFYRWKLNKALEHLSEALDIRLEKNGEEYDGTVLARYRLGLVLRDDGQDEAAVEQFQSAVAHYPSIVRKNCPAKSEILQQLIAALERLGRATEAEKYRRKVESKA